MPERMTVIKLKGDTDAIIEAMSEMQPLMQRVGRENGALSHISARTDDGVVIVNLWRDAAGSDAAAENPEVQEALGKAMAGGGVEREIRHYDVVEYDIP